MFIRGLKNFNKFNVLVSIFFLISLTNFLYATEFNVPGDFDTIQEAIDNFDRVEEGDHIILAPGIYYENINLQGRGITIRCQEPISENVSKTILDGSKNGTPIITFTGVEAFNCIIRGLTLKNGNAPAGSAIYGNQAHPTIEYCIIEENECNPTSNSGGIIYNSLGLIQNNLIRNNNCNPNDNDLNSSVIYNCDGSIDNNIIIKNKGCALSFCNGNIRNNTIYGNYGAEMAGAIYNCNRAIIMNCILWNNLSSAGVEMELSGNPNYCCIKNWDSGGSGILTTNPLFADENSEDFHLQPTSPCIDAGGNAPDILIDFEGKPRPVTSVTWQSRGDNSHYDMGAYEYQSEVIAPTPSPTRTATPTPTPTRTPSITATPTLTPTPTPALPIFNVPSKDYPSIVSAVSSASNGGEIIVAPGFYKENIVIGHTKNIIIRSTDPSDTKVVQNTIIDGNGNGSVISFSNTPTENCAIIGLTIQNGAKTVDGAAINCKNGNVKVKNNMLKNNKAFVEIIPNVESSYGGVISQCTGSIEGNLIENNIGCAIYQSSAIIKNNMITMNNLPKEEKVIFGIIYKSTGTIQNNVIANNTGAGIHLCSGTIVNNTIYGNSSEKAAGGMDTCDTANNKNNILWNNVSTQTDQQIVFNSGYAPTYCNISGWTGGGTGNISLNPLFRDAGGYDFGLLANSPCIDKGTNTSIKEDIIETFRPLGTQYDIGAYEYIAPLSTQRIVPDDYPTIQEAIDAANHRDEIVLKEKTYKEKINLKGKNVIIRSTNPTSSAVRDNTIIDGTPLDINDTKPIVTFAGTETSQCMIRGLKFINGETMYGSVFYCNGSKAIIEYNNITQNKTSYPIAESSIFHRSYGKIANNLISSNNTSVFGIFYDCDGKIINNILSLNNILNADSGNNGIFKNCDGTIQNNTISNNTGYIFKNCDGGIVNNMVVNNKPSGTANNIGLIDNANGIMLNNVIGNNNMAGISDSNGIILNNTIYGNSGLNYGGLINCLGLVKNDIIYNNSPSEISMLNFSLYYCCVKDYTGGGQGNISLNPLVKSPTTNDFSLQGFSPCIDTGSGFVLTDNPKTFLPFPAADINGQPRPFNSITSLSTADGSDIDIGAYEYPELAPVVTPTPTPTRTPTPSPSPTPSPTPTPTPGPFTVSGSCILPDVTVYFLTDDQFNTEIGRAISQNDGYYSFDKVPFRWTGKIVPQKFGYGFSPLWIQCTNVRSNLTDQNFVPVTPTPTPSPTPERTPINTAPQVDVDTPDSPVNGTVSITYTAKDIQFDRLGLSVFFSINGGFTFAPATLSQESPAEGIANITSSPAGIKHRFMWDSNMDIPSARQDNVIIKMNAFDGEFNSNDALTGQFIVDNTTLQPVISGRVYDINNHNKIAQVLVELFDEQSGAWIASGETNNEGHFNIAVPNRDIKLLVKFSKQGYDLKLINLIGIPITLDIFMIPAIPNAPTDISAFSGAHEILVRWNANPEADLEGYNIYRSTTGNDDDFTKINDAVLKMPKFIDKSVTDAQVYYYKITAVDKQNNESLKSQSSPAVVCNTILLNIPDNSSRGRYDNIRIPFSFYNAAGIKPIGINFYLKYDNLINPANITVESTTITQGFTFIKTIKTGNILHIEGYLQSYDDFNPVLLIGEGHLFDLVIPVSLELFDLGKCVPVEIVKADIFDINNRRVTIDISDIGQLCFDFGSLLGDLNNDRVIDIGDFLYALKLASGILFPINQSHKNAADYNGDSALDCGDANIIQRIVANEPINPKQQTRTAPSENNKEFLKAETDVTVSVPIVNAFPNTTVNVPVEVKNALGFNSCQFTLCYPDESFHLNLISVKTGELTRNFDKLVKYGNGFVTAVFSNIYPNTAIGNGSIAVIEFQIQGNAPYPDEIPLFISDFRMKGEFGNSLDWKNDAKIFIKTDGKIVINQVPTPTPSPAPSPSPTVSPSPSPSPTPTPSPTPSPTRTATPTPSPSPTRTPRPTPTNTPTPSPTPSPTPTPMPAIPPEFAAVNFQSVIFSDLRCSLFGVIQTIQGRVVDVTINLDKANPVSVIGSIVVKNIPQQATITTPIKSGKVGWDSKNKRVTIKGEASVTDRTSGEKFKIKFSGYRNGDALQANISYEFEFKSPTKSKEKGTIAVSSQLNNPQTSARADTLKFIQTDRKSKQFKSTLVGRFPWGDTIGTVSEKRSYKSSKLGSIFNKREYTFKFNSPIKGKLTIKTNYTPLYDSPPLDIYYVKFEGFGMKVEFKPPTKMDIALSPEYLLAE